MNKKVIEGNKFIDVFMGENGVLGKEYEEHYSDEFWRPTKHKYEPEDLEYHSSWDWLMPVCIKLGMATVSVNINQTYNEVLEKIKQVA